MIVQVASKVLTTILGLWAVVIMTRYLGTEGFGEYTTIITFLGFFGVLADFGLTLVTVQMISRPGVDEKKVLDNLFSLRLLTAIVFLGIAPIAGWFSPYGHNIKVGILIAVFSFFFVALDQIFTAVFQKNLRMDQVSIAECASRVALIVGTIAAARLNWGLAGIMMAIVAGNLIQFVYLFIASRRFVKIGLAFDFSLWREVAAKSWPLAVTIFFNLIYLKADTLFLSLFKSQSDVGIYGAAYKVIDILTSIPFIFAGVVLPIMAADWASKSHDRFYKVFQKSFDLMAIVAIPLVIGGQFLARPIMVLVAGQEFAAAGAVLRVLMIAVGFVFMSTFLAHAVIALDKQKKTIPAYIFTATTSVIGYLILIPRYSYFGAAAMTIYSEAAIAFFMLFYFIRYAGFAPCGKIFGKSFVAAVAMGMALWLLPRGFCYNYIGLFIALIGASAVYFAVLYVMRGISQNDIGILLNDEPREEYLLAENKNKEHRS